MKRWISFLLILSLMLGLTACGGKTPQEPDVSVYKRDVQEYITEVLDSTAKIDIFEKSDSRISQDTLEVICIAMFSGSAGQNKGEFTLTYAKDGKDWTLEKCRVDLDSTASAPAATEAATNTETATEASTDPAASDSLSLSDDWKEFTFELGGVTYQLPTHYQNFVDQGWTLDTKYSDVTEDDKIPGYSRAYVYLTNGAVTFNAELINMSGNARVAKDCDIGGITVEANDNLNLKVAKGLGCLSTVEEIQEAFGTPSNINLSEDYSSLQYDAGDYCNMKFYIYNPNTTYNEVTLRNFVARERDATTPTDVRPEYLDSYVAPTTLGNDPKVTRFELDGVMYQLPCPLDAFLNNGWTVKSDRIGTLGAWQDSYGVTIAKGDYKVDLTMINLSDYETYTKNCAVSGVSISGLSFKGARANIVVLPGWITLQSKVDDVKGLYSSFERYDGTYAVTFTYNDQDYTTKVKYSYYADPGYVIFDIQNDNWTY